MGLHAHDLFMITTQASSWTTLNPNQIHTPRWLERRETGGCAAVRVLTPAAGAQVVVTLVQRID